MRSLFIACTILSQWTYFLTNGVVEIKRESVTADIKRWKAEVLESLKLNIRDCAYNITIYDKGNKFMVPQSSDNSLQVTIHYPSEKEVDSYRRLPSTLSAGNEMLLEIIKKPGIKSFLEEKGDRWMIPPEHPGQNRKRCVEFTKLLGKGQVANFYDRYKSIERVFYLIRGKNALVHATGSVMFSCGTYQGSEACETRWEHVIKGWIQDCRKHNIKLSWDELITKIQNPVNHKLIENCNFNRTASKHISKLYVMPANFDSNFHHLIADSLARITRYLPFLRRNTDVMIHVRMWELRKIHIMADSYQMDVFIANKSRNQLFELLGISTDRLVSGNIVADKVYIPRAMSCSFALFNPTEFRLLAFELTKRTKLYMSKRSKRDEAINKNEFILKNGDLAIPINLYYQADDPNYKAYKKNIVILHRQGVSTAWGHRTWTEEEYFTVDAAFKKEFPDHNVIRHASSTLLHKDFCMACEISELMNTDILVAIHGAGLTKEMFMPPGGLIVEMSSHFNDVQMPVCGYYGNIASMFGHNHYLYAYDKNNGSPVNQELNPVDLVQYVRTYYDKIHSASSQQKLVPTFVW